MARGSYVSASDLTPWGGPNLYGGVINGNLPNPLTTYTVPGQVLPVSGGVAQSQTPFQLPGCSAQNVALAANGGGGCAWDTNAYKKIQPRTEGLDVSAHWTQRLSGGWTNALSASYYLSQSEQYRQPNSYNVGIALVPFAWAARPPAPSTSSIRLRPAWFSRRTASTTHLILPVLISRRRRRSTAPISRATKAIRRCSLAR